MTWARFVEGEGAIGESKKGVWGIENFSMTFSSRHGVSSSPRLYLLTIPFSTAKATKAAVLWRFSFFMRAERWVSTVWTLMQR